MAWLTVTDISNLKRARSFRAIILSSVKSYTMRSKSSRSDLSQHNVPEVFRLATLKSVDLYEVTVEDLQHHMSIGTITSVDYVTYCLERIRTVCTPLLNI